MYEPLFYKAPRRFADKLLPNPTFEAGCIEKRNNAKRWIEEDSDLAKMYQIFRPGSTFWCEGKSDEHKSADSRSDKWKSAHDIETPATKRTVPRHDDDVQQVMEQLQDKHAEIGKYIEPQLRPWARMIARGYHKSLDDPPNIPLITGKGTANKPARRDELSDDLVTTMKAASQYFSSEKTCGTSTENSPRTAAGISPSSKTKISGMYLSQLKSLQELRASAVLSEEEFEEQKKYALMSIRGLKVMIKINPTHILHD